MGSKPVTPVGFETTCTSCGEKIKKTILGSKKGFTVINKIDKSIQIRCKECGEVHTLQKQSSDVHRQRY